ncbi:32206_t:CDS:2 [Gigaspora margarita]|uniref:32206_t:CDS:1 n=1 Tax=Gigaspora margarita TaxID=4874 RepID=A0ABN7W3C8_GIGMA|nr:32206_t:CDS:2 [Gigaspora margarita]
MLQSNSNSNTNNIINYKEQKNNQTIRSFTYIIKNEGVYPSDNILVTTGTSSPNKFAKKIKIPNNYIIITTWGCGKNKRTICCSIKHKDKNPEFIINHGDKFTETVISILSASNAALIYLQLCDPNSKTTISGSLVFGLQLETLNKIPKTKKRLHKLNQQCNSLVQTIDRNKISHDSYHNLTIDEQNLLREWVISNKKNEIAKIMDQAIKTTSITN